MSDATPTEKPQKIKKEKPKSRSVRWNESCAAAREAFDDLRSAFEDLDSIRQEYEEWKDNLPENLQSSALGEKLEAVTSIDFESCLSEAEAALDEAESADLPQGFGRD